MRNNKTSWKAAESFCQKEGGHLASVTNKEEQEYLLDRVGQNPVWIGATEKQRNGFWEWTDCNPFNFIGWAQERLYLHVCICLYLCICIFRMNLIPTTSQVGPLGNLVTGVKKTVSSSIGMGESTKDGTTRTAISHSTLFAQEQFAQVNNKGSYMI